MIVCLYVLLILLSLAPVVYAKLLFESFWNPVGIATLATLPIKLLIYSAPLFTSSDISSGLVFALIVEVVYVASQTLVTLLIIASKQGHILDRMLNTDVLISEKNLRICVYFLFFMFVITFLVLASSSVGIIEWLKDPRYAYINHRRGNGALYALSVNFVCLAAFFAFINSRSPTIMLIKFVFYGTILVFFGSKGGVIALFVAFVIVDVLLFGFKIYRYMWIAPVSLILIGYMVLQSGLSDILAFLEYFDYFSNAEKYYADYLNGDFPLQYGKIFLSGFWGMVPRSLIDQKPIVYGILHIVENYYPGGPASGNTPAFGARVQQFADFGLMGVVFFAILSPWNLFYSMALVALFKNKYNQFSPENVKFLFLMAMLFGPQFGVFFHGVSYILFAVMMFVLVRTSTKFTY